MQTRVIINATAIGRRPDGIAVYGVHLVRAMLRTPIAHRLTLVLTDDARRHVEEESLPEGAAIRWVTSRMSPAHGTRGNLRRWLFANALASSNPGALVFGLSQIEAPIVGRPGVVMVHDLIPLLFREAHPRQRHFYHRYLGPALRRALAVIAPSQATAGDLGRHYRLDGSQVHVIPHGSPVAPSQPTGAGRRPDGTILCIGRPGIVKNLEALVTAFRSIEPRVVARLVITGASSLRGRAVGEGGCGPGGRVAVLGPVSESEKIALLDRASVLVCPSRYEGFGLVPLEAMARGCPVIAARAGALPEVCGDAAFYIDPDRPDSIADGLLRVLGSAELQDRLAARGAARAAAFSWANSAQAHLAVFDRVARLDGRAARSPDPSLNGHGDVAGLGGGTRVVPRRRSLASGEQPA